MNFRELLIIVVQPVGQDFTAASDELLRGAPI
jgi:hypothetical protein